MNNLSLPFATPEGKLYVRKDAVLALLATNIPGINKTVVQTMLYLDGQELPFNLLEDVETVRTRLLD
jgi:hypothetical protein